MVILTVLLIVAPAKEHSW